MCDLPEEEFAEYLSWLESARVRASEAERARRVHAPSESEGVPEPLPAEA